MKQQTSKTSRRGLLKAALSLGVALGTGSLAHAANNPFVPGSPWSGNYASLIGAGAGSVTLTVTQNGTTGVLIIGSANTLVIAQITWNGSGWVNIDGIGPYSGFHLSGAVAVLPGGNASVMSNGIYLIQNVPGLSDDFGKVAMENLQPQGLVSPDPQDANIPSISIVPPDFLGTFESRSGFHGEVSLHCDAVPSTRREGHSLSKLTGLLRYNDMIFNFVMTFAPTPNTDGSFTFDLIGGSVHGSTPVPLTGITGRFYPGALSTIRGTYQRIGTRGTALDLGTLSLLQVP